MQNNKVFVDRRLKLMNKLDSGIVIIPTSDEAIRNNDATFQYRFDSNFYYLSGFNEPQSVIVLDIRNKKSILFCREKNFDKEIWDGYRYGVEASKLTFGFEETFSIDVFAKQLNLLMQDIDVVYYSFGNYKNYDKLVIDTLSNIRKLQRRGVIAPQKFVDINTIIGQMRLIKDEFDIQCLSKACEISVLAHLEAMQFVKNAKFEYEIQAKLLHGFYMQGAQYPAYNPIVASGANACVLHYTNNNAKINNGDLLLVDAGCEYDGFAGDITRTYPVNGTFTRAQSALYEIVLEANKQAIKSIKPGILWNVPGEIAIKILTQGLIDLKLLHGNLEDNIVEGKYKKFYMHGIGHWLGLDVHDAGLYKVDSNQWCKFEQGMCTTIEPGLYVRPDESVSEEYWNIGIRIEDDILVTANGINNLTQTLPKEISEIQKIINHLGT